MKENKKKRRQKICLLLGATICLASIAAGAAMLFRSFSEYKIGSETYRELEQFVTLPETDTPHTVEDMLRRWPTVDFEALWEVNPDVVAWLYCEGTAINYPVVQGRDNEYYLRRLLDGSWNIAGSLFVDADNQLGFIDHNTIIYGHNLKDKSMFWSIAEYKKQDFYDAYPIILLITPENNYEIWLFSGYVADPVQDDEIWSTRFGNKYEFQSWIDTSMQRSTFICDVEPSTADRFITLSTCSYEWENARYVVVGRLVVK